MVDRAFDNKSQFHTVQDLYGVKLNLTFEFRRHLWGQDMLNSETIRIICTPIRTLNSRFYATHKEWIQYNVKSAWAIVIPRYVVGHKNLWRISLLLFVYYREKSSHTKCNYFCSKTFFDFFFWILKSEKNIFCLISHPPIILWDMT